MRRWAFVWLRVAYLWPSCDCVCPGVVSCERGELHRAPFVEMSPAQDAAGLEGVHGDLGTGLALFDTTIDSFHQSGNAADTIGTLGTHLRTLLGASP